MLAHSPEEIHLFPRRSEDKRNILIVGKVGLKRSPLLGKGGVAAAIKKMSRSHLNGRGRGGPIKRNCFGVWTNHPVRAFQGNGDIS